MHENRVSIYLIYNYISGKELLILIRAQRFLSFALKCIKPNWGGYVTEEIQFYVAVPTLTILHRTLIALYLNHLILK